MFWRVLEKIFRFLSSLELAVFNILTLAVVLSIGTVFESKYGAKVASQEIYRSIWMQGILWLLLTNIAAVAFSRWPWKKHHVGFLITHLGLIVLLFGSFLTQRLGIDGSLALAPGESTSRIKIDENMLNVFRAVSGKSYDLLLSEPLDLSLRKPLKKAKEWTLPDPDGTKLRVVEFLPKAIRSVTAIDKAPGQGVPAFHYALSGSRANMEDWVFFQNDKKIGCIQCKLLLLADKNKYDYAGEYLNQCGFLVQRANYGEIDNGQYDQKVEILAAKSAGMFIRKDVFDKIGGFDEDYFIYVEETDLGWRSWLAGYKTVFCPKSVVYHEFGTSIKILSEKKSNFNVRFHGTKNYIMTLIKNLGNKQLLTVLPRHVIIWIFFAFFLVFRGNFRSAFNVLGGIWWNVVNLPQTIFKRKKIQLNRVISDEKLFKIIIRDTNIFEKVKQFFTAEKFFKTTEN